MVKLKATRGRPPGAQTAPGAPFMSAGCANQARPEKGKLIATVKDADGNVTGLIQSPDWWAMAPGSGVDASAYMRGAAKL